MQQPDRWDDADEKRRTHEPILVEVTEANRGGLYVRLHGLRAFLPASQAGTDTVDGWKGLVGRHILVEVLDENDHAGFSKRRACRPDEASRCPFEYASPEVKPEMIRSRGPDIGSLLFSSLAGAAIFCGGAHSRSRPSRGLRPEPGPVRPALRAAARGMHSW